MESERFGLGATAVSDGTGSDYGGVSTNNRSKRSIIQISGSIETAVLLHPIYITAADIAMGAGKPDLFGRRLVGIGDLELRLSGPNTGFECLPRLVKSDCMQPDIQPASLR